MKTTVCTLFEGDFQDGVGVLLNSLYAVGFRGNAWVGYRGDLPRWSRMSKEVGRITSFIAAPDFFIRFVEVETSAHFTNFKPEFMLEVLDRLDPQSDAIFYLDPDIVAVLPWTRAQEWIECGVAVCEDVNSPIPLTHPRRVGWRKAFAKSGVHLQPRDACYANGGCVGLRRADRNFLVKWKQVQEAMWEQVGGAEYTGIDSGMPIGDRAGFFQCFSRTDQDALNAAIEASPEIPVSFLCRQAMGFSRGAIAFAHALGLGKPWKRSYLADAFHGKLPRLVDKLFWNHALEPIPVFDAKNVAGKKKAVSIASFIGRFYHRN